jgi:hypothetical protein
VNNDYVDKAKSLLSEIGGQQLSAGVWTFTGVPPVNIHHSQIPVALVAYAAFNVTFAAGGLTGWTLVDMVDKVPCMDGAENTALAMVCGASIPTFSSSDREIIFGHAVWGIVEAYSLEGCFERVEHDEDSQGSHYNLRPRGFNWAGGKEPVPESLKAMRKSYRAMSPLQQIMVLTIMHLYCQGKDKTYLTGGCPTKIPAAQAMNILRSDGPALSAWGHMVTHYAGW